MPLQYHFRQRLVLVPLVWHAELVVRCDLGVADFFPFGRAAEVLRAQGLVAQDFGVGGHGDELGGRHRFPELVEEGPVVDA